MSKRLWMSFAAILSATACAPAQDNGAIEDDPAGSWVPGKADTAGMSEGSYEAAAVLYAASSLDLVTLDDTVGLNARAARNIVAKRATTGDFQTLADLDAVSYVGVRAITDILEYVRDNDLIGRCGDGEVQAVAETCDDGNQDDGDGCAANCHEDGGTDFELGPEVHGILDGSYDARGILAVVNEADFETLDDVVGLDRRAATKILALRPFTDLETLDAASYVGNAAFNRLLAFAQDNEMIPSCGDGEIQPGLETCDDGNQDNNDDCDNTCGGVADGPGGPPYLDTPIVHDVQEGSYEGIAILAVANGLTLAQLDFDVGLDTRAAKGIAHGRTLNGNYHDLTTLDAAPYVARTSFQRLLQYGIEHQLLPSCGDNRVQPVEELCDGTAGCDDECRTTYTCGNLVVEEGELCDDGNLESDDGCRADCKFIETKIGIGNQAVEIGTYTQIGGYFNRSYPQGFTFESTQKFQLVMDVARGCDQRHGRVVMFMIYRDGSSIKHWTTCGEGLNLEMLPGRYEIRFNRQRGSNFSYMARVSVSRFGAVCGNGQVEDGEACDDGNWEASDGCSRQCQIEVFSEQEPNNNQGASNFISTYFKVRGSLSAGDEDWFSVLKADGDDLSVELSDGREGCGFDAYLEIYNQDGEIIGEDDDSGNNYCPALTVEDLDAGSYFIRVRHHTPGVRGSSYTLDVD